MGDCMKSLKWNMRTLYHGREFPMMGRPLWEKSLEDSIARSLSDSVEWMVWGRLNHGLREFFGPEVLTPLGDSLEMLD